jgi:antitoxin CptB
MDRASTEIARLRWRCRRGMRELDVLLVSFLNKSYGDLPVEQKRLFADLLELPDPDLHAHLVGRYEFTDPSLEKLLQSMRVFGSN